MAKLYNLARMTTATTGTGTITLGAAVSGFLTFALAGVANGDVVSYSIRDGSNSEVGTGTYTTSGTTLTRTVLKSTNSDNAISLSGSAQVFITPSASDMGMRVLLATSSPSGTGTVTFGSISGSYTHLRVEYVARSTQAGVASEIMRIELNADTTAGNYRSTRSFDYGVTPTLAGDAGDNSTLDDTPAADATAGCCSIGIVDIPFYAGTTFNKMVMANSRSRRDAGTIAVVNFQAGIEWESTVAITRVDFKLAAGNFVAGSQFNLYGLK